MSKKVSGKQLNKVPSYLPVYNALYDEIVQGKLKTGDLLPSENELSKSFSVSRNTIRQALTILKEDGLIEKQQGKGSVVVGLNEHVQSDYKFKNPMVSFATCEVDSIELTYNFNPATKIAKDRLKIDSKDLVLAANIVYKCQGCTIGHAFVQVPMRTFKDRQIDLNKVDDISNFIHETIYELVETTELSFKITDPHENINNFLNAKEDEGIIYLESIMRNKNKVPIGRFKYYMIDQYYNIYFEINNRHK